MWLFLAWIHTYAHDDVIKWKHFPRNWPFVRRIHRWPVNSPHKGQWRGALMFSLICAWINGWVNNGEAGGLRRHRAQYDVTVIGCGRQGPVYPNVTAIVTWPLVWASCQIRKIAGCACAGNAGNVSPHRRLQRKPLVSDPGMHPGTCVTHVPWCMSGSLTCGGRKNVPGIPGACALAILRICQEAHGRGISSHGIDQPQ